LFIIFIILGITFVSISSVGVKTIEKFCAGTLNMDDVDRGLKTIIDDIKDWELKIAGGPTTTLCTAYCPCPASNLTNPWLDKYLNSDLYEARANNYSRTLKPVSPIGKNYSTLVLAGSGAQLLVNKTYVSYWDCVVDAAAANSSGTPNAASAQIPKVSEGIKNFASSLESALTCNGICHPGIFYFFKSVVDGPPTRNCVDGLLDIFKDKPLGIGVLLLVSFALTAIAHLIAWGMCCRCCGAKDEKKEDEGWKQ
jgi:hypothetical protein